MGKFSFIPILVLVASVALGAAAGAGPDLTPSNANPLPNDDSAQLVARAHALELSGQRDEALVDYTEAIESRHLNREAQSRALFDRGLLLDSMNRLSDALQDYGAAVSLSPKFAAALNNRANVYRRMSRFKDAKRDYQASLAAGNLQGQYPYYGLGQIAEAEGKPDQAKALYRKALAMEPDFVLASQKLAALEDAGPIHLHPPATAKSAEAVPPITLRPPKTTPKAVPALHTVHLRPPVAEPASYDPPSPALKPALDQARGAGGQVQLGAWRTEAEAIQGWDRAMRHAGGVLAGFSHQIVAVDLPGKGRYYRLRVGTDGGNAQVLCAALEAKGLDCMQARD